MAFYGTCLPKLSKIIRNSNTLQRSLPVLILSTKQDKLNGIIVNRIHTSIPVYKRRKTAEERKSPRLIEYSPKSKASVVDVWRNITVSELAQVLNRDVKYVYDIFLNRVKGPNTVIEDMAVLQDAIKRSGHRMRVIGKPSDAAQEEEDKDVYARPPATDDQLKPRPPVVTVMGHVDHGKTTLLDALRDTRVVDQEFGGITQHIGAFSVRLQSGAEITFLDTPGHAAFTAMRERGANITDIVVLVVAADDGVMEQTVESIRMAKQAKVPILIAINKIDSPKADVERAKNMLLGIGIQVESLGGDVQAIPISALKRQNLDQLTEALVLQADLLEIGADPEGPVEATVVESKIHQHKGKLCTVVIQRGTLRKGDVLVSGTSFCKVRALRDDAGRSLDAVKPGYSVEIEGWKELPSAGDQILQVDSEKRARQVVKVREEKKLLQKQMEDAEVINQKEEQHNREYKNKLMEKRRMGRFKLRRSGPRTKEIQTEDNGIPSLNIIVKADVDGTLEALLDTLDTYDDTECNLDLVHYGVGAITESDIELAKTFSCVIYAFNVDCPKHLEDVSPDVKLKHFNVIYKLVDDVKNEVNERLPPLVVEEVLGEAKILQQFDINDGRKKVPIAGSRCVKGVLKKSARFRLVRDEEVLHDGPLSSMRHLKNEVDSVKKDLECGLQLFDKSVTFKAGDMLVCYEMRSKPKETKWDPGF